MLQFTNNNESNRYCEAKELFDSAYALIKTIDHQWRHMMLCLNVANNERNNYRTCQSLYDFLKLSLSTLNKEPVRGLNKQKRCYKLFREFRLKTDCSKCINCKIYLKQVTELLVKNII